MKPYIAVSLIVAMLSVACSAQRPIPDQSVQPTSESDSTVPPESGETARPADDSVAEVSPEDKQMAELVEGIGALLIVDGVPIPPHRFARELQRLARQNPLPEDPTHTVQKLLDQEVEFHLVDAAVDEAGIEVSDQELQESLELTASHMPKLDGRPVTIEAVARQLDRTPEVLREMRIRKLAVTKLLELRGLERPTTEEMRAYYQEHLGEKFTRPDQIFVQEIAVKPRGRDEASEKKAESMADDFYARATDGETDFADITETRWGDEIIITYAEGFMSQEQLGNRWEVARELETGAVSEPFRGRLNAWTVIKAGERRMAGRVPFEEVAGRIEARLFSPRHREARKELLAELRDGVEVIVHTEEVEKLVKRVGGGSIE